MLQTHPTYITLREDLQVLRADQQQIRDHYLPDIQLAEVGSNVIRSILLKI